MLTLGQVVRQTQRRGPWTSSEEVGCTTTYFHLGIYLLFVDFYQFAYFLRKTEPHSVLIKVGSTTSLV